MNFFLICHDVMTGFDCIFFNLDLSIKEPSSPQTVSSCFPMYKRRQLPITNYLNLKFKNKFLKKILSLSFKRRFPLVIPCPSVGLSVGCCTEGKKNKKQVTKKKKRSEKETKKNIKAKMGKKRKIQVKKAIKAGSQEFGARP